MQEQTQDLPQIRRKDLNDWLNSTCTKALLKTLQEYKDAAEYSMKDELAKHESPKDIDLYKIAEFRGNSQSFSTALDIADLVLTNLLLKEEVTNEDQT